MPNDPNDTTSVFIPRTPSIPDSPDLSRTHCYGCDPAPDPKLILRPFPCILHSKKVEGTDDEAATTSDGIPSGSGAADGNESNRAACEIVHRERKAHDDE